MPSQLTTSLSATEIRWQMRARRRAVPPRQRRQAAQRVSERLWGLARTPQIQHIAVYLACDGELDTQPLIEHLWSMGKQLYLPVIQQREKKLLFAPLEPTSRLRKNRYNISEPVLSGPAYKLAQQLDLILLPLVAVDQTGTRLGMGGGYYDRTLAFCQHSQRRAKPRLIGLSYEFQAVSTLTRQSWDIPLQGLITEQGYYPLSRNQISTSS